jgi:hypothetical protein
VVNNRPAGQKDTAGVCIHSRNYASYQQTPNSTRRDAPTLPLTLGVTIREILQQFVSVDTDNCLKCVADRETAEARTSRKVQNFD